MNDWERLRSLLLEQERHRLSQLETQQQTAARQRQLGADLPAVVAGLGDSPAFRASLSQPVTAALHESIKRDRDSVASLLFPVIGPAIRRAVQESLRSVLQRINLALEYGLSPRAWRWRLQAWRSGESFAQIVLRHSLAFSVDEIFVIHRDSGLMVARRSRREVLALDQDAVASMLTAIQNFLRQSLGGVADDPLRTVELGSATLWLVNGPQALLAAVIRGEPPITLRDNLQQALEQAHSLLGEKLSAYTGNPIHHPQLNHILDQQLIEQVPPPRRRGPVRLVWALVLLVLATAMVWWGWQRWQLHNAQTALARAVEQTPGLILIHARTQDNRIHARLLRDPLAPRPEALITRLGLDPARFVLTQQHYLAQEPALILRRLHLAAGLENPERGNHGALILEPDQHSGTPRLQAHAPLTPSQWRRVLTAASVLAPHWRLPQPPLDTTALRQALQPPPGVTLDVTGDIARFSGTAPAAWRTGLTPQIHALNIRYQLDLSQLTTPPATTTPATPAPVPDPAAELQRLVASVNGTRLNFTQGVQLNQTSSAGLADLAARLSTMDRLARELERDVTIVLSGMSDGIDSWELNQEIRHRRAETIAAALIAADVRPALLHTTAAATAVPDGFDAALRYTEVLVRTE